MSKIGWICCIVDDMPVGGAFQHEHLQTVNSCGSATNQNAIREKQSPESGVAPAQTYI